MNTELSNELFWLTTTALMTALFWVPYIINRMLEQGIVNALWDRHGITDTNKAWANRMMRAHDNAVENLVIFAPLVIIIQLSGINSSLTATACMPYFFARLAHFISYSFALPILRVVTFLIGFGAQLMLALILLGWL